MCPVTPAMGLVWLCASVLAWVIRIADGDALLDLTPEVEFDVLLLQTELVRGMHLKRDERTTSNNSMKIEEHRHGAVVFTLAPLPYPYNALEPEIDAETMFYHHDKHHQAYIDNLNVAIEDRPPGGAPTLLQGAVSERDAINKKSATTWNVPLLQILQEAGDGEEDAAIRNNAGGAWNHYFFWLEMAPASERGEPSSSFMSAINKSFGSFEAFQEEFAAAGTGRFGSGFAWLVLANGKLQIMSLPNQDNPLMSFIDAGIPIMALDVWEHAYYLNYRNARADYIAAWWDVVHWNQVNLWYSGAAQGQVPDVSMYLVNGTLVKLDEMVAPDPPAGLALYESGADNVRRVRLDAAACMNAKLESDPLYKECLFRLEG